MVLCEMKIVEKTHEMEGHHFGDYGVPNVYGRVPASGTQQFRSMSVGPQTPHPPLHEIP